MEAHGSSLRTYFAVFTALLVLTAITVGVAYVDLGILNIPLALAIAGVKATLVVAFFMHLRFATPLTTAFVLCGFAWLIVLIVLTLGDVMTRAWIPVPNSWLPSSG